MNDDLGLRQQYENMTHKEKKAFIRSQSPVLVSRKSSVSCMLKKYGKEWWGWRLKCGWGFMLSSTSEESVRKYNEFMGRDE